MNLDELKPVAAAVATAATQQLVLNDISVPVIGAQLTVVLAGAIGALATIPYREPGEKRSYLFGTVIVATILGPVMVVLMQYGLEWAWLEKAPGPMAVVISFLTRLWMPGIIDRGRDLIKKVNLFGWAKTNGDES